MHIAIDVSTWLNRRGYGRFTREMTRALVRLGRPHTFTLVADSGSAAAPDLPDAARVVVSTTRAVIDAASDSGSRSLLDLWHMKRAFDNSGFDAIVFPTSYSFVPVRRGPRVAIVIHDALPEMMPADVLGSRRAIVRWTLKTRLACRRADVLATVSQASALEIGRRLPVAGRTLTVLTEGVADAISPVETPLDQACLERWNLARGAYVLCVGGLSVHKRVPDLVRAFADVVQGGAHPHLKLVLTGPDDQDSFLVDRRGVAEALRELGPLADRVVRTGFVDDSSLAALYRQALCTAVPSVAEGFGLPALESMASGTPVVARRNAAVEEVCGDAADYADQAGELAGSIRRLLDGPERRTTMRAAGLRRAALFSWDEGARRLLSAIETGA